MIQHYYVFVSIEDQLAAQMAAGPGTFTAEYNYHDSADPTHVAIGVAPSLWPDFESALSSITSLNVKTIGDEDADYPNLDSLLAGEGF